MIVLDWICHSHAQSVVVQYMFVVFVIQPAMGDDGCTTHYTVTAAFLWHFLSTSSSIK